MTGSEEEALLDQAHDFLEDRRFMVLSTAGPSGPWACTLAYAHSADLRLYFLSKPGARHVDEVQAAGEAAAAIYEPPEPGEDQRHVRQLQVTGPARRLEDPDAALEAFETTAPDEKMERARRGIEAGDLEAFELAPRRAWYLEGEAYATKLELPEDRLPAGGESEP